MEINIIPVIDVMNGSVIHAVAGKRNEYKPISRSIITSSPNPEEVLRGFKKLGCSYVYIADLDAIMDRGNNEFVIDIAVSYGFKVLADIGRRGLDKKDTSNILYVIGTEYIVYPDEIDLIFNRIISLDIKNGKVLFKNKDADVSQVAKDFCNRNPRLVIVLNLDRVGTSHGIDIDTLKKVKINCEADIAVGGGLGDIKELELLKNLGIKYVLVATAIHRGIVDRCVY